jgi:class 3 adenylate cyclase/DNA-binding beta-propeller fold protein YncE
MIRRGRTEKRLLATVLFTDMVGSTERAIELGDRAWQRLLKRHHSAVRGQLRRFGGHEVDSAGDGFFATFPQPADAVRCALAIRAAVRPLEISVRSAVHVGEVERIGPKVGGVAVHLAARALSAAESDEILVTSTVRDLVAGSELKFADAGTKSFKGFAEPWHVYRVTGPEPDEVAAAHEDDERASASRRTAIALGGVIGAAVMVGVIVLLGVSGNPPEVEAGPNTVARLGSNDQVGDVLATSRGPSALVVSAGALWVASEAGTVTRVELEQLTTQVAGGVGIPTTMAVADGTVWVGEAYAGRISRIDAATVQVRERIEVHGRRMIAAGDAVWVTDDVADRVVRVSTATLAEDAAVTLDAGSGPRGIAVLDGSLWVANERAATVVELDAAEATTVGHPIGLGSSPTEIATGAGSVWVTSMGADRLYRIDPDERRVTATIETCDGPDAVVASDDAVWVACRIANVVRRISTDGTLVADVAVPGIPSALAVDGDGVWVALRGD